ncbi:MAG TPA: fatty acid desaturase family protein [Polyangia bacterium]|jgi:ubiquitin-conjugating enzyme E2 variant|nr:fatty acid desaturase family protein [Polyangia bacterium]
MDKTAPPSPSYGRGHRALEIASIAFVFGSLFWIAYRVIAAADSTGAWIGIALAAVGGYIVSDFLSGVVHWAGDTVGDETTPIFGPNFVKPFRFHHVDPEDITRHDFVETNGNNCIVASPVLLLVLLLLPHTTSALFYTCVVIACTALFVFATNQFHKWAHMKNPARWVRLLQRANLILSPEHHVVHHTSPRDKYYCITVGWMNPLLDKIHFFRFLEAVFTRIDPRSLRPDPADRPQKEPDAAIAMPS